MRRAFLFLLIPPILLAACGGGGGADGLGSGDPSGEGALVMTRPDGIVELSLETGQIVTLVGAANPSEFFLDVAVSPDGSRIAYVVQPPARIVDNQYDAGSDLWIMNRDGSQARVLFEHVNPNQLVRYPQWQDNGTLLAVIQEPKPIIGISLVEYTVQRLDVETGARERLVTDALVYSQAPDAATIVFARLSPQSGESLIELDVAAGSEQTLIDPSQNLQPFNSPHHSPDGRRIAFASADQTQAPPLPPGGIAPRSAAGGGGRLNAPSLDGLPQDIWIIDAEGGTPALLAPVQEDFPSLTWDGSGEHIYVLGAYGLYDVNVENGNYARIGEGAFHGSVAWAPPAP